MEILETFHGWPFFSVSFLLPSTTSDESESRFQTSLRTTYDIVSGRTVTVQPIPSIYVRFDGSFPAERKSCRADSSLFGFYSAI